VPMPCSTICLHLRCEFQMFTIMVLQWTMNSASGHIHQTFNWQWSSV
jgi:hypothetical protein